MKKLDKYSVKELKISEKINIEGGGFWDAGFEVLSAVYRYSSPAGAIIEGVGSGILDAITDSNQQ